MDDPVDPLTGLPSELFAYQPDEVVYDAMVARHGPPDWLDELDLRPGPPHVHMGTHATTLDRWLLVDDARPMELALRERLLAERRAVVFGCLPAADAAAEELLHAVLTWLADRGVNPPPPTAGDHPLVAAGRIVQEDLCLMVQRDGAWHLDGGVVCFPTLWRLGDRLGQPTPTLHERVAHYDELEARVDRFFDRFPPDRVVWRRNMSIKPYSLLHVPAAKVELPMLGHRVAPDGSPFWIRTERQTLRRLPASGAIVFAIKVQQCRAGVLHQRPDIAAGLAAMYRTWDAPMRAFKFAGSDLLASFLGWLDAVAAVPER